MTVIEKLWQNLSHISIFMKLFFLWVMLYLCPDAHGVLLVDQEVSTPKPVVRNAPCQAREVLDTVCWGPLYVEFVIKYHAQYASMLYYMDGIDINRHLLVLSIAGDLLQQDVVHLGRGEIGVGERHCDRVS